MKYYDSDGTNQYGPFSIEELSDKKIIKETLIWHEGIEDWKKASDIPELANIIAQTPPPISKTPPDIKNKITETQSLLKSGKKKYKIVIIALIIILSITSLLVVNFYVNSYNNSTSEEDYSNESNQNNEENYDQNNEPSNETDMPRAKTSDELKRELYEKEKRNPKSYLSATFNVKNKFFSGKTEVVGEILNSATIATFKDVVLIVKYFSSTQTEIDREEFVVYDYVVCGFATDFKLSVYPPGGTRTIGLEIKTATPE